MIPEPAVNVALQAWVNFLDGIAVGNKGITSLQFGPIVNGGIYHKPSDFTDRASTFSRVTGGMKARGQGLCANGILIQPTGGSGVAQGSGSKGSYLATCQGNTHHEACWVCMHGFCNCNRDTVRWYSVIWGDKI